MDPINKLTRLLETLRLQQSATGKTRSHKPESTDRAKQSEKRVQYSSKRSLEQLSQRIGERINRLAPNERQGDKGTQVFIDSILAWEFGEELLQSESFSRYSNKIQEAIRSDDRLNNELKKLLESLQ